jgi:hypothetical protein
LLILRHRYSSDTIFPDIHRLTETLHRLYPTRILSYALMIGGLAGKQQQHRRQAVIDRCGFDDHQIPLLDNLPFGQAGPPEPPVAAPYDEPYLAAFSKLLGLARHAGARVAMTGIGGDELVAPYATEAEIPAAITSARTPLPEWLGPRTLRAFGEIDDGIAPSGGEIKGCIVED